MTDVVPVFDVAYGLTLEHMQQLGLFISGPRNGMDVEGAFAEPGLFVINQDNILQIADISNVPFARPKLDSLVKGIRFIRGLTETFPTNGTYA